MSISKPSTVEHFEVSYTDLAGDRRAQTSAVEADAKDDASRFAEEGMADIGIVKVVTTRTGVPFKAPKPGGPGPDLFDGADTGDSVDAGSAAD